MDDIEKNKFVREFIGFLQTPTPHDYFNFSDRFSKLSLEERTAALLDILILLVLFRDLDGFDLAGAGGNGE